MRRVVLYLLLLTLVIVGCTAGPQSPEAAAPAAILAPPTPYVTAGAPALSGALPTPTLVPELAPATSDVATSDVATTTVAPVSEVAVDVAKPPPPPTATAAPGSAQFTLGAGPGVPAPLVAAAQELAANNRALFVWVETDPAAPSADVLLTVNNGAPLADWVYAAAAPFATVPDGTTAAAVTAGWASGASDLGRLLVDPEAAAALAAFLGPGQAEVVGDDFIGQVWAARPSWILVPFERLRPEFKVLAVDGRSPLTHDFTADGYPLVVPITVAGSQPAVDAFLARWQGPTTNRDPQKLTRVALTGVTALVRATAAQMENRGILWPGEEVAPVLQGADIAHVSNEVSFAADCPPPDPYGGTTFCSRDPYFELLTHLGIDVVELTGNHVNDYGRDPLARTLDMYAAAGMQWFGGGRDLADAGRAAVFDHNGNRIAFVGCNPVGPANAWALADAAGSRPCGPDLTQQITQLRDEGHVVIATLQFNEYYDYFAPPNQRAAFGELAAAGAAGVSGSQGHHAQGFDFRDGSFIHYGLGNLFFDQMDMLGTRQTFVDTYVVYDGRLISVDLWTGLIENWARPRLMTPEERADLLETVFRASGW